MARFGGSWMFIIAFGIVLFFWILFSTLTPRGENFDPYPSFLMNLILSCVTALQAPIIMMSQNRQEEKDRKRNKNDYLVNLKAEIEIRSLHQKMDILLEDQINMLFESHAEQITLIKELHNEIKTLQFSR